MPTVSMTVNGKAVSGEVEARTLLVEFLRSNLGLTGTHVGCDTSQCGACVIHMDGVAVKSCTTLALQAEGAEVTTIEGVASNGELHPHAGSLPREPRAAMRLLHAGHDHGRYRHGRTAMAAASDEATIRQELEGNMCRCTGYHNIVKSIAAAAKTMS